jgi:hypothetical protein
MKEIDSNKAVSEFKVLMSWPTLVKGQQCTSMNNVIVVRYERWILGEIVVDSTLSFSIISYI